MDSAAVLLLLLALQLLQRLFCFPEIANAEFR
jgi:hypothetical protein